MMELAILNLKTLEVAGVSDSGASSNHFWSPDSQSIGFRSLDGGLRTVDIAGGTPRALQTGDLELTGGASWGVNNTIVFSSRDGIFRTDRSGGNPQQVTRINKSQKEESHLWPRFLPDGHRFLYTVTTSDGSSSVYVGSLDGSEPSYVIEGDAAIYLAGHLLYVRDRQLFVQACDESNLKLTGEPVLVVNGIFPSEFRGPAFSATASGLVVFDVSGVRAGVRHVEYDRSGNELRTLGEPGRYSNPVLSPDQSLLLFNCDSESGVLWASIFAFQLDKGTMSRFTFGDGESDPVWSPDGSQVAYCTNRPGQYGLHTMDATPGSKDELLLESDVSVYPNDWSPDGQFLIYTRVDPKTDRDLWLLSLPDKKASLWLKTQGIDDMAMFSPDGRWIAYASQTDTGHSEVYIKPHNGSGGMWQVSTGGGRQPHWRGDGKELFFASAEGTALLSVPIASDQSLEVGTPRKLFDVSLPEMSRSQWVVTKDGQRFIVETRKDENVNRLSVITNWRALVR